MNSHKHPWLSTAIATDYHHLTDSQWRYQIQHLYRRELGHDAQLIIALKSGLARLLFEMRPDPDSDLDNYPSGCFVAFILRFLTGLDMTAGSTTLQYKTVFERVEKGLALIGDLLFGDWSAYQAALKVAAKKGPYRRQTVLTPQQEDFIRSIQNRVTTSRNPPNLLEHWASHQLDIVASTLYQELYLTPVPADMVLPDPKWRYKRMRPRKRQIVLSAIFISMVIYSRMAQPPIIFPDIIFYPALLYTIALFLLLVGLYYWTSRMINAKPENGNQALGI